MNAFYNTTLTQRTHLNIYLHRHRLPNVCFSFFSVCLPDIWFIQKTKRGHKQLICSGLRIYDPGSLVHIVKTGRKNCSHFSEGKQVPKIYKYLCIRTYSKPKQESKHFSFVYLHSCTIGILG